MLQVDLPRPNPSSIQRNINTLLNDWEPELHILNLDEGQNIVLQDRFESDDDIFASSELQFRILYYSINDLHRWLKTKAEEIYELPNDSLKNAEFKISSLNGLKILTDHVIQYLLPKINTATRNQSSLEFNFTSLYNAISKLFISSPEDGYRFKLLKLEDKLKKFNKQLASELRSSIFSEPVFLPAFIQGGDIIHRPLKIQTPKKIVLGRLTDGIFEYNINASFGYKPTCINKNEHLTFRGYIKIEINNTLGGSLGPTIYLQRAWVSRDHRLDTPVQTDQEFINCIKNNSKPGAYFCQNPWLLMNLDNKGHSWPHQVLQIHHQIALEILRQNPSFRGLIKRTCFHKEHSKESKLFGFHKQNSKAPDLEKQLLRLKSFIAPAPEASTPATECVPNFLFLRREEMMTTPIAFHRTDINLDADNPYFVSRFDLTTYWEKEINANPLVLKKPSEFPEFFDKANQGIYFRYFQHRTLHGNVRNLPSPLKLETEKLQLPEDNKVTELTSLGRMASSIKKDKDGSLTVSKIKPNP